MRTAQTKELISSKCRESLIKRKSDKVYIGSFNPYGYIKNTKTKQLILDKNTASIVYQIFDLYDKGYGYTTIAEYLNERGIVCPSIYRKTNIYISSKKTGTNYIWTKSSVRKIIINKVYNGYYLYSNEKTHQEIINDSLWNRVQERLLQKKNCSGNDFYDLNGNKFNNKVYCKNCSHVFTIETSRCKSGITKYLRCSCYDKRGKQKYVCSNKLAIKYNDLKDIIAMFIEKEVFNRINIENIKISYLNRLKQDDINIHRLFLKQERKNLTILKENKSLLIKTIDNDKNNSINLIKLNTLTNELLMINNRLKEINNLLKQIYGFARTISITDKDIYIDKFIIDNFIDKIVIDNLINNERNIEIILK